MTFNISAVYNAVVSHAMASGLFDRVGSHEPKNAPGNGITCSVIAGPMRTLPAHSGLDKVTIRAEFRIRIYMNMLQEPQDAIDETLIRTAESLMSAYCGDFELGGNVKQIDIFGSSGNLGLTADPGYVEIDKKMHRIVDIVLPVIVNDVWDEVA